MLVKGPQAQPISSAETEAWDRFYSENWEKAPIVLSGCFPDPADAAGEILNSLKNAGDAWRAGERTNFGLWINGNRPEHEYERFFVDRQDASVCEYVDRVLAQAGVDEFCFTHFNLQQYEVPLWFRARNFLSGLLGLSGLPSDEIDLDIFTGRYAQTPGGIHTDAAGTFMCVLEGTKRMYVWPADYFDDKAVSFSGEGAVRTIVDTEYQAFLDDATELVGSPGDVLYWPSTSWHISIPEDSGAYTLVLNIGLFFSQKPAPLLRGVLDDLYDSFFSGRFNWGEAYPIRENDPQATLNMLPQMESDAAAVLAMPQLADLVAEMTRERWMQRVSAGGFRKIPPKGCEIEARNASHIQVDPRFPILHGRAQDGVTVAANGHLLKTPDDQVFVELIDCLNGGDRQSIRPLARSFAARAALVDETDILDFLHELKRCHS
jgi:50S ribosomal protein L16 3-hydroxylase